MKQTARETAAKKPPINWDREPISVALTAARFVLSVLFLGLTVSYLVGGRTAIFQLMLLTVGLIVLLKSAEDFLDRMQARANCQSSDTSVYQWHSMIYHQNPDDTDNSIHLELRGEQADRFVRDYNERAKP